MSPIIQRLGRRDYLPTLQSMQQFTATRTPQTGDEIWLVEHPPVYTLGQVSRREHLRVTNSIPVVQTDRGGQITYHGPGQIIAYTLLDIVRRGLGIRYLVNILEQAVVNLVADYGIRAYTQPHAPGVYVETGKIAFLGLRIRHGRTYHGLSLNVAMDLSPFADINPCGYAGLPITQLADIGGPSNLLEVTEALLINLGFLLNIKNSSNLFIDPLARKPLDPEESRGS